MFKKWSKRKKLMSEVLTGVLAIAIAGGIYGVKTGKISTFADTSTVNLPVQLKLGNYCNADNGSYKVWAQGDDGSTVNGVYYNNGSRLGGYYNLNLTKGQTYTLLAISFCSDTALGEGCDVDRPYVVTAASGMSPVSLPVGGGQFKATVNVIDTSPRAVLNKIQVQWTDANGSGSTPTSVFDPKVPYKVDLGIHQAGPFALNVIPADNFIRFYPIFSISAPGKACENKTITATMHQK